MIAATIAPTWMIAVYAVTPTSSTLRLSSFSATVRCPVELTGRNSVTPSTTPSSTAFQISTRLLPQPGLLQGAGELAQGGDVPLGVPVEAHQQRGDAGRGVGVQAVGDPVDRADE